VLKKKTIIEEKINCNIVARLRLGPMRSFFQLALATSRAWLGDGTASTVLPDLQPERELTR